MNFKDEYIERIDLNDVKNIYKMIVEYLCGENYHKCLEEETDLLSIYLSKIRDEGINYAQFNELLLIMNQDRVQKAFFDFFFGEKPIKFKELKKGIIKFRGFAMLCVGNFRFAYKQLYQKEEEELLKALKPYCDSIKKVGDEFKMRPPKALDIEKIKKEVTWYSGYLAKKKYEKEIEYLEKLLKAKTKIPFSFSWEELFSFARMNKDIDEKIKEVEKKALKNTDIYLTWDYMDIYIATSMRHKWEFEETFDFINKVFNYEKIKKLKLRYFDPTQSLCENRIDKGLVEGLMLKRASCTIYMAQEIDTMGKDSELAATLAQRKPVIAYVPYIDIEKHAKKIVKYPLDFFKKRFLVLQAEEMFDDENCRKELEKYNFDFKNTIDKFIDEYENYRYSQPFSLWDKEENKFKKMSKFFSEICNILAIAEHYSFERRADTLKKAHPLSVQVHLESGVANGVLVVRNAQDCASLLYKILKKSMEFTIKHIKENGKGMTILEEKISKCPYRVVTDYEKLTNSFWNFYLISE